MVHTHVTAPTRFVESDGIRFAYRRFGQASGMPLLFFQQPPAVGDAEVIVDQVLSGFAVSGDR